EREAYRVKLLMGMIDQREKTIVFCATQAHALMVRDLINQMKTSTDPCTVCASRPTMAHAVMRPCAPFRTTRKPSRPF
ncbi:MAG: hypothetical protein Q7T25_15225, partial [Sideroxyarcus sp.]|nr:hypothetical protein [Sideroxyarcus sp.]